MQPQPSQPGVVPAFAGGQVAQGARLGMLGNTSTMTSPFNVTSYTDKFIRDQQAATGADALILDPSVRSTHPTGGIVDSFNIRGFPINEGNNGEFAFEGLYGIAPSYRIFTDYVERIEVLKGPSAALSGIAPNGGVGGVINVVPKRAGEDLTRLTASYGSTSRFGGHWDVARRYGESRQWGVRASGSLRGGDTPIDRQSETTGVGALALDYQGERYRSWLYLLAQTDRFDAPSRPFLMAAGLPVPKAPDGRLNVTQPWEWSRINDQSVLWRNEYDVTDQVTLFADVGGSRTNVERFFGLPTITNALGNTTSTPGFFGLSIDRHTYDGGVRARFDTGFVRHAVTFQGSVYHDELFRRTANGTPVASNIYSPTIAPTQFANEIPGRPRLSESNLTALSIADTMSVLDERILLTLGVRRQGVEANNYVANVGTLRIPTTRARPLPVVGLVVRPMDNVSLYANYIEGLSEGDIAPNQPNVSNPGEVLAPYIAKQYEAGIKVDFGRVATTFSAFEISKASGETVGRALRGDRRNAGAWARVQRLRRTHARCPRPRRRFAAGWHPDEVRHRGTCRQYANRRSERTGQYRRRVGSAVGEGAHLEWGRDLHGQAVRRCGEQAADPGLDAARSRRPLHDGDQRQEDDFPRQRSECDR